MRVPILHIIPFLWSGAGSVVTRLCEAQRQHGPVAIVTSGRTDDGQRDWDSYRRRLRRAGVTHHTIDFFHRADGVFWSSVSALAEVIRDLRPGVIHAHAGVPCCGAVAARAITRSRARIIGQMYSWGPNRPEWMNVQDTWGLGQADRVVCSARGYWDLLRHYGVPRRKLAYLPWGLPLDQLAPRPHARDRDPVGDAPAIGFVGRIEPRKGQRDLVAAFARIRRQYPRARLELVGPVADQDYASAVRADIAKAGLCDAVSMPGEVIDPAAHVRQWDLFVSLSSDEGQGLAVLEAMALGVPVIARPVAGISDYLVDGRTGFAIPHSHSGARGVAAAAASMRRTLLAAPAARRRVVRGARRMVERRYAWASMVTAFDRLYGL